MDTTTAPAHGTPEAKARIKELQALAAPLRADLLDRSDQGAWQRNREEASAMSAQLRAYDAERIALETCPLPCPVSALPAQAVDFSMYTAPRDPHQLDASVYTPGDHVTIFSRGSWRRAVVVQVTKTRMEVAYTTQGALREAADPRYRSSTPTVTRKMVKLADVWGHTPQVQA